MNLKECEKYIGYTYKNIKLLERALIHSSYGNEKKIKDNERLEFLGDSVLSLIISDYIFKKLENVNEGKLTQLRASLVCEQSLARVSKKINLGNLIFLGHGEEISGGRERASVISDAFEAVLASVYLDGGIEKAREWLMPLMSEYIEDAIDGKISGKDYKTRLQEKVQKKGSIHQVIYKTVSESGEDHNKRFKVEVQIDGKKSGIGEGGSKKEAEQMAAKYALEAYEML